MQESVICDGNVYHDINSATKEIQTKAIDDIGKRLNVHDKIMSHENGYETN